jgi:hypothetical protein
MQVMRAAAITAGRDPEALEYTRWGQISMTAEEVQAQAELGVARLIVGPSVADQSGMRAEISSFAHRQGLG